MENKTFEEIKNYVEHGFEVNIDNLEAKSISLMTMQGHILSAYVKELKVFKNMITDKESLYGHLYEKLRFDNNRQLKNKTEIDPFIWKDETYYALCLRFNDQECQVKYFEEVLDSIKKMSYHIGNIITLEKIKRGIQ